ncbi:HAD-IA family hydrolase [Sphingomonas canadensis]|uniref:HAD-IA family hydrolase n=1 Tax=Sphingomonas canadensis TaxID=1219257 RepID=A0ABW3H002_9SPHN|nr:HAD-IA family hydrolase [Sphingomonas canadensis]MCW3835307.1 HAD-IA family hydrolase [Sphingomonas canadensis]
MTLPDRRFAAFLFDMDGTLVNSIAAANRIWRRWALRHGIDPDALIAQIHGVRAIDTVRRFAPPGTDAEAEAALLTQQEIDDVDGIVAIRGAAALVARMPPSRCALVTSAPRALALRRLEAAGVPVPEVVIAAEDVARGKPAPDPFLAAAAALGVDIADCLVWEDTATGLAAADAAGAGGAIAISETHHRPLDTRHPVRRDYRGLDIAIDGDGIRLVLSAAGD